MQIEGEQVAIDADGVAAALNDAESVIIVPGYGMAVSQAQQSVSELTRKLRAAARTCASPSTRSPAACRAT
jgi:NAD(P) transhydrogenase subunit beta